MKDAMTSESSTATTLRDNADVAEALGRSYAAGFVTESEMAGLPLGRGEGTIRGISAGGHEAGWLTEGRVQA
jgi:Fe-S cluster assembly protein SufB